MADDESRGVHLSDKQLVFVFMAATVLAVVVFLFGVLVGRGVHQARGPISDDAMTAAEVVPDGPPEDTAASEGAPKAAEAAGGDGLSYPARLGKTSPADQLRPAPRPPGERPADAAPPDVPGEPVAEAGAAAPAAPAVGDESAAASYTVQVAAVRSRSEADGIVKGLKAKGYDAYVFVPEDGDRLGVFRVRIGSFKQKRQAELLAERLLREDRRYKPWVTR